MCERLVHKADFERLLAARSRSRSTHFAVHHVAGRPAAPKKPMTILEAGNLSTEPAELFSAPVDKLPDQHWLGCLVPKRHARRAVTRSLLKRQMRSVFEKHASALAPGLWLLRLSQSFAVAQFPSAQSAALSLAARNELEALLLRLRPRIGSEAVLPLVMDPAFAGPDKSGGAA